MKSPKKATPKACPIRITTARIRRTQLKIQHVVESLDKTCDEIVNGKEEVPPNDDSCKPAP